MLLELEGAIDTEMAGGVVLPQLHKNNKPDNIRISRFMNVLLLDIQQRGNGAPPIKHRPLDESGYRPVW
jgi:hypothetical protein